MADSQDRDQQILSRLSKIEHRVDSIDQTSAFALRAEEDKHMDSVRKIFGRSKRLAQVYMAADGHKGVEEIAKYLGIKRQHVGRALKELQREALLELSDSVGGRDIWAKKALDRTLRISSFLESEFNLKRDGRPLGKSKKHGAKRKRR